MSKIFLTTLVALSLLVPTQMVYAASNIEQAQALLDQAVHRYKELSGYQATFVEKVIKDGRTETEESFLKFQKPFTIYMGWTKGTARGRQLIFAEGYFEDKMLVRPPGFLFTLIPLVALEIDDPRVLAGKTHTIKSAGIGAFLMDFAERFAEATRESNVQVLSVEPVGETAQGIKIDVVFSNPKYPYERTTIVFSESYQLPIEIGLYKSKENLSESYEYLELALDASASDESFRQNSDRRLFNKFQETQSPNPISS